MAKTRIFGSSLILLMCLLISIFLISSVASSQIESNSVIKDSIPPEAIIKYNSNIYEVNGFDDKSNVTITKKITCLKKDGEICIKELRKFIIKDEDGNDLTLTAIHERIGGQVKTTILNLKYHGENVDDYNDEKVGSNWFWVYNFANFQQTRIQTLKIRNEYVTADYNPTTNKTRIEIKNKTNSISYTKEGYYNIELYTDKGKLKYDIQPQQIASVEPIVYKLLENNTWVNIFVKMRNDEGKLIDEIVNNLNNQEFSLEKKSIYHDAFSGDISKAGLNKLVYNSNVRGIYPNRVAHV